MAKRDDVLSRQRDLADLLVESSTDLAHQHRWLLYANHFGPNAAKALREKHR